MIDSHCHLDDACFDADRDEVIARARQAGVEQMLTIGSGDGPPDLEAAVRLADRYDCLYASVGVHPHDAGKATGETFERLTTLLSHPKVPAVGEIGLDYHYDHSPRDVQKRVFLRQMEIAAAARKPILIHTREAWDDTIALLDACWKPGGLGGVLHCFSGDATQVRQALDLGLHISYAGIVTFKRAEDVRRAAATVPLDRLLVETDAPYLTPHPHRKVRRNEPRFIVETARCLAELRGLSAGELDRATTRNFRSLFRIPEPG